jgi:hypothetical protein
VQEHVHGVLHRTGLSDFAGVYEKYFVGVGYGI